MKIKNILKYHKNTVVAVLSVLMAAGLAYQWLTGVITFGDMCQYLALIGGAVATVVGFLSPDGKNSQLRDENRKALIAELKAELQENETPKNTTDCPCGANCHCVLKEDAGKL